MKEKIITFSMLVLFLIASFGITLKIMPIAFGDQDGEKQSKEVWQLVSVTNTHENHTTSADINIAVSSSKAVNVAWSINITRYFENLTDWQNLGYYTYTDWLNGTKTLPYHWGEMDWFVSNGSLARISWDEIKYWWDMYRDTGGGVEYETFMGNTYMADCNLTDPTNDPDIISYNQTHIAVPWYGNSIVIKDLVVPANTTIHLVFKIVITEPGAYTFDLTSLNPLLEISPSSWRLGGVATLLVPDEYAEIQDAIDAANPEDAIIVYPGTYTEQLIVNKSLTLQGQTGAKIIAPDTRNAYTFSESSDTWDPLIFVYGGTESGGIVSGFDTINVTIVGFEIDGGNKAAAPPTRFVGILYRNVNPGVISNNTIHDMYDADGKGDGPQTFGLMVYGDSDVRIEYNDLSDFSRGGICVRGDDGAELDPVATVEGNNVTGNGLEPVTGWWAENGIQIAWGAGGSIAGNNVSDCQVSSTSWVATGIMVYEAANGVNTLDNSVADCDTGIAVISGRSFDLIDGNVVTGCTWDGIRLGWPVDNCTVSNNIVSYSWAGIGVWDGSDNDIENNILKYNEFGIYMDGDSHNNMITANDILNNTEDGIHIEPYGGIDPSGTEVHFNNIADNDNYGVNKVGLETVDAENNWWSSETGPHHPTLNPNGLGDNVTDNVDYIPWLVKPYTPEQIVPVTVVYVDPQHVNHTTPTPDRTFQIDIKMANVSMLYGFQFKLKWNSTLLNLTREDVYVYFPEGWLGNSIIDYNVTAGNCSVYVVANPPAPPLNGSATLVSFTFRMVYEPIYPGNVSCGLTLEDVLIGNPEGKPIIHVVYNGTYSCYATKAKLVLMQKEYVVKGVPTRFHVNVNVTNVVDLDAFNFTFTYDPNLLKTNLDNIEISPLLSYTKAFKGFNNGTVFVHVEGITPRVNGTAVLVTITFDALGIIWNKETPSSNCTLALSDTGLFGPYGAIEHDAVDGTYSYQPVPGDLNIDGIVDIMDLSGAAKVFGTKQDPPYHPYDLNCDGEINILDLILVARNFTS